MELTPDLTRRAHRIDEKELHKIVSRSAEDIEERLSLCTFLGEPIDFDDWEQVVVATYYLGRLDFLEEL